jgi:hypothetical protein
VIGKRKAPKGRAGTYSKDKKSRGAPRTAEQLLQRPELLQEAWTRTLRAISKMRSDGLSMSKAAKEAGISPGTVRRLGGRAIKKEPNGRYSVARRDSLLRVMQVPTPGGSRDVALRNSRHASVLGQYWDAVQKYLRTGDSSGIEKFRSKQIKDANGQEVPLITDLKVLDRLGSAGTLSFESLYARSA